MSTENTIDDADTTVVPVDEQAYLSMSDEDIMKMSGPVSTAGSTPAASDTTQVDAEESTEEKRADESDATGSDEGKDEDDKGAEEDTQATEGKEDAGADGGTPASKAADDPKGATDSTKKPDADAPKEAAPIDFEAEYKRLLAPFKANGREVRVDTVDDAINLMQMGANYNKKMAALKPNLKLMKMLENNGLLSEEKINFLIDVDKKVPGAISKLVKESGIDPLEIDAEKASAYKQSSYAVDEREIDLDTVLDELKDSATYNRTLSEVSNKWDVASKQVVSQDPRLLKVIDGHMANGIYDLISTEIERERMLGRLTSASFIDAYRQVGDSIQARGGFNHLFKKEQPKTPAPDKPVIVEPKPKAEDTALKDKRRAAAPTKAAASTGVPKDFNPLSLSDEEFSKLAEQKFR